MTDMDWADVEAEKVGLKLHWDHKSDCAKIAAALRKAKADAFKQAAIECRDYGDNLTRSSPMFVDFFLLYQRFKDLANKLESPTD